MELEDITGIKKGYGGRLRSSGINTAIGFYQASMKTLKSAFHSIVGYHWWIRLHGWEADDREFGRKSFGHSHALFVPYRPNNPKLHQIICQLSEKTGRRLRNHGYKAYGIHVGCFFSDYTFWHEGHKIKHALFSGRDLYDESMRLILKAPVKPVRNLFITCFNLVRENEEQLDLFEDKSKVRKVVEAIDKISDRWGDFTVIPGRMLNMERKVLDRIAFGGIKELEEFTFKENIENDINYYI